MSAKGKEISVDERKIILKLREDGKSFREIGRVVNRTESLVRYAPEPAAGCPGGPDDPRGRGMSGTTIKWYLRHL